MKTHILPLIGLLFGLGIGISGFAQNPETKKDSAKIKTQPLFASDDILYIKVVADFKAIQNDRGDTPVYHEALLTYVDKKGDSVQLPVKMKVRGNFRRKASNCNLPPLLLNFPEKKTDKTIFKNQDKLKLVTRCRYEEYVPQEYMVYKLYNLLTDYSFRVRMAQITYEDAAGKRKSETSSGFIIEDEEALAKRHRTLLRSKDAKTNMAITNQEGMATVAVLEYMIGNTDWSVPYQHNIKLLEQAIGLPMPVAYDFDHAGIVEASYANPAPELGLRSTRERLYRGLAYSEALFQRVFENFNRVKPDIYALYEGNPHLNPAYVKRTLRYLDDFYEVINDPNQARSIFMSNTQKKGDGVTIKGLNN
jgi:hypothetical protein